MAITESLIDFVSSYSEGFYSARKTVHIGNECEGNKAMFAWVD